MVLLENAWLAAVAETLAWLLILAALAMYRKRNDINPPADNVLRWIWSDQRIIQMSPDALDLMQWLQIPITTQAVIHILSARFSDLLDMNFTALTAPSRLHRIGPMIGECCSSVRCAMALCPLS